MADKIDEYFVTKEEQLKACNDIIDALSKYHPAVKLAALKTCIETFPKEWQVVTIEKKEDAQ